MPTEKILCPARSDTMAVRLSGVRAMPKGRDIPGTDRVPTSPVASVSRSTAVGVVTKASRPLGVTATCVGCTTAPPTDVTAPVAMSTLRTRSSAKSQTRAVCPSGVIAIPMGSVSLAEVPTPPSSPVHARELLEEEEELLCEEEEEEDKDKDELEEERARQLQQLRSGWPPAPRGSVHPTSVVVCPVCISTLRTALFPLSVTRT
mmetsp:Transcript_7873/g.20210  ORF Transcript_7873/g.20210 Transcript_7873/m.20210 type:complete len:204 (-) Transcript_7873:764-1375(-)